MSLSLVVILALEESPDSEILNSAAREYGIQIQYEEKIELQTHSGFLPLVLKGEKSGFESYSVKYSELDAKLRGTDRVTFDNPIAFMAEFGGNKLEVASVFYTAFIISAKFNGVVFDRESAKYISTDQLFQVATYFNSEAP